MVSDYYSIEISLTLLFLMLEPFTIRCSAPQPNGSEAPFNIQSTISFKRLCKLVALKMERHPELLRLLYRLDTDKVKQASTSISNNEEFNIFIGRLRDLIVPGRLPSGRKSTRAPKNPLVQFNDASLGNGGSSQPSKGVSIHICLQANSSLFCDFF